MSGQKNRYALDGRTVIVTGGGAGIGLGIVEVLARQGARVVMAERNERGEAEALTLREQGADVHFVRTDVGSEFDIDALFEQVDALCPRLDALVNNAGLTIHGDFLEMPVSDWQRLIDVNLRSVFLCTQRAARRMARTGGGSIVNIASNHAGASTEGFEAYAATKGGIVAMTRALAWSLGRHGIRVNAVSPGLTMTDHIRQTIATDPVLGRFWSSLHATGRFNEPADVGEIVAFLLSDAAVAFTGTDLLADNGLSAHLYNRPSADNT